MNLDIIAYNIKFFREQKGWTQQKLADLIVTSRSNIAKWESNTAVPDIQSLIKLCDLFHVSLDLFVGRQSLGSELLLDFKRIYASDTTAFDEDVVDIVEYIIKYPAFKEEIYRLKKLPFKNQLSIHELFSNIITQIEKL